MMKKILFLSILILYSASCGKKEQSYMGSRSCRECHEHFYELWETSYHGRAMQNFTAAFADTNLSPCDTFILSSDEYFRFVCRNGEGIMITPRGDSYPVRFVLGGKYVYYFLTPMDRENCRPFRWVMTLKKRRGLISPLRASVCIKWNPMNPFLGRTAVTHSIQPVFPAMSVS
ncbi:MAG: hypothetical protein U5N56_09230 [Candidatus Marinimicrobia bacterium]|nr:hypothetical protein [Candidatus Neomarinimicrobiota bacterium]